MGAIEIILSDFSETINMIAIATGICMHTNRPKYNSKSGDMMFILPHLMPILSTYN